MEVRTATDVGQVRENNEDALWVTSNLLVVCDGMGGHVAGEVASGLAIEAIQDFPFSGQDSKEEVLAAIHQAQDKILAAAKDNEKYHGMGSTITLAWIAEPNDEGVRDCVIGHVGDSRCYVYFEGNLQQITSDHSVVGELVRTQTITCEEAKAHPKKHVLTQVLGANEIKVELIMKELKPGAIVMLCTDGLTDLVNDDLIKQTLKRDFDTADLAQNLVDLANESGGVDNVTVIVAKL